MTTEELLLAALIPNSQSREAIQEAKECLAILETSPVKIHFSEALEPIYKLVRQLYISKGRTLDEDIVSQLLKARNEIPEKISQYVFAVRSLRNTRVSRDKFESYLESYYESLESRDLQTAVTSIMEALTIGHKKGGEDLRGVQGAHKLLPELMAIPSKYDLSVIPQGNILDDAEAILSEYKDTKTRPTAGVETGIRVLDRTTGGLNPGDLCLVCAATGEGKSMTVVNMAYHVSFICGLNCTVFTLETLRTAYRRRIIARHSCNPLLGLESPLEYDKIKKGQLGEREPEFLKVLEDIRDNPNYGDLDITQLDYTDTVDDIRARLDQRRLREKIDVVFVDYVSLLSPTRRRGKRQEELTETIQQMKRLATSFNTGRGIPIVTAYQISSQAREKVRPTPDKFYTVRSLSDTSEAQKSADIVLAILRTDKMKEEKELMAGILKARDAEIPPPFKLYENFSSSYLGNLEE